MRALRHVALAASVAALTLAGAAHAADATPSSPALSVGSCGPSCQFNAVTLPGGLVEVIGAYDCASASCWNGDPVKLHWNVGAARCVSATATAYDPQSNGGAFHSVQVSRPLKADGASFEAGGFQVASGAGLQGFFFNVVCHR